MNLTEEEMNLILDVTDHFDFEKVHKAMVTLNWEWKNDEVNGVPELWQVKKSARHACLRAIREGYYNSGGWEATFKRGILELKFILEHWDSFSTRGK